MSDDENSDDEVLSFPAIDRAMKILSNRLGIDNTDNGGRIIKSHTLKHGTLEGIAAGDNNSRNSIESQTGCCEDEVVMDLHSGEIDDHVLFNENEHQLTSNVSLLSGLGDLARERLREEVQHEEKLLVTQQASVLRKALKWCSNWTLKRSMFQRIELHMRRRIDFRDCLRSKMLGLYSREKYYLKFSYNMKRNCKNRFGTIRLSELYCRWRIKRMCFRQWTEYIVNSAH